MLASEMANHAKHIFHDDPHDHICGLCNDQSRHDLAQS